MAAGDEGESDKPEDAGRGPALAHFEVSPTQVERRIRAYFWCRVEVKLLPEVRLPDRFKLLRPNTILPTGCKSFSRLMLHICEQHDVGIQGTGEADRCC